MRIISRSNWRKLLVLMVAIIAFVLLYETRMLDTTTLSAIMGDSTTPLAGSRLEFNATAYCKGTTTASGVGVRTGIAAADPTLLPVGTVLNIATGDQRYNGVYTVMDTGPKVQGRILDLYMWNCNEALRFGRRQVRMRVVRLGWNPHATTRGFMDRLFRKTPPKEEEPPPIVPPAEAAPPPAAPPQAAPEPPSTPPDPR